MGLAALVLVGGLVYWVGLISAQRAILNAGVDTLLLALIVMLLEGNIDLLALPVLLIAGLLAVYLKHQPTKPWAVLGWTVFIVIALALGFRALPLFEPINTLLTVEQQHRFPPEKAILLLLVPPMVLASWATNKGPYTLTKPPSLIALLILAGILLLVIPIGLLTDFLQAGFASVSATQLLYGLTYNLIYTCVLEESFFRGIVQTALIRGFSRRFALRTAMWGGIAITAILFGLSHIGGGLAFVLLATIAGFGYGLTYELTGRLHYAVLVHFAVNAIHRLAFAGG